MHSKNIKLIVRKQLKKQFPNWNRLNRKEKKEIAEKVLAELVAEYDFKQTAVAPKEDLLGIEQQMPTKGINKQPTPEGPVLVNPWKGINCFAS